MDVKYVATLANLPLTPAEEKTYSSQLTQILDYISQLQKVDTSNVSPTSQVTGRVNSSRDDQTTPCLPISTAISQAESSHQNYFTVPAVLDND